MHIYIFISYAFLRSDQELFVLSLRRFQSIPNRLRSNRIEISMIRFLEFWFDLISNRKTKPNQSIRFETESFRGVSLTMYVQLNTLLAQRRAFYVVDSALSAIQRRALQQTTQNWKKIVETFLWMSRRMSLYHNSIESKKIDVKQNEIIKNNTSILYCLMNILRNKWIMSASFLRLDENFFMRSTRVHHLAFNDDDDDDEKNKNDEDDENNKNNENDEHDENDDVENDETQTTRRK